MGEGDGCKCLRNHLFQIMDGFRRVCMGGRKKPFSGCLRDRGGIDGSKYFAEFNRFIHCQVRFGVDIHHHLFTNAAIGDRDVVG